MAVNTGGAEQRIIEQLRAEIERLEAALRYAAWVLDYNALTEDADNIRVELTRRNCGDV